MNQTASLADLNKKTNTKEACEEKREEKCSMKKSLKSLLAVCLAAAMAVTATGCGGSSAPASGGSSTESGAAGGEEKLSSRDTLNMACKSEPTSLDPAQTKDLVTWAFMYNVSDSLIYFNWETQEYEPAIATEWSASDDGLEYTFTIRDGVKFHNGDTMTVDDVVFSLNRAIESSFTAQTNGCMDHFEKVDDSHVKAVLKYAYAPFIEIMTNPSYSIVSERAVKECEAAGKDFGREPVGCGAYKLKSWQSGNKLEFERFDDYYRGTPKMKNINWTIITDASAGAMALESGEIDYYYKVSNADFKHLSELPNLQSKIDEKGFGLFDITFNTTDGPFKDVNLRKAVAYAINREELVQGGAEGYGVVDDCWCATGATGYLPDFKWYEQDLDKAKECLAAAGYPNGIDVVFTQDSSDTYMAPAEIMQAQLAKVGINVTFEKLQRSVWIDTVSGNRQFEASLRMTNHVVNDAEYLLRRRLTSAMLGGGNNYAGYQNPEFDKLVDEATAETDTTKRNEIFRQCYEMIKEDVPAIPLYTSTSPIIISKYVKGWTFHPLERNVWANAYLVEE